MGLRSVGTTHWRSGDFMERQSALRRIAYEVLDIPGIPPGTELAARTLLEAVQAERLDETRVAQYALDLQMCLAGREHYRDHHARLQKLVNQANRRTTHQGLGSHLLARINDLIHKPMLMVAWMVIVWLLGSTTALIMVATLVATFCGDDNGWRDYSGFSAPMVALCAAILVGISILPKMLKPEKELTTAIGTVGLIASAFLWLINVMSGGKYLSDPNVSLGGIFQALGYLAVAAGITAFIFVLCVFIFVRRRQIMRRER